MTEFRIRRATSRDIKKLMDHRHRMFEDMYSPTKREQAVSDRAFPSWALREMRAKRLICFLVETRERKIVGGGTLWLREVQPYPGFPGGRLPYLMSMYTEPNFRRKGIGTMVVKRAVAWSKAHRYALMSLHASKSGRPLYIRLGWKESPEMTLELR